MNTALEFAFPRAWQVGLPLVLLLIGAGAWLQLARGTSGKRVLVLSLLRTVALGLLVLLAARPVWLKREPPAGRDRPVVLLLDRSESMSLEEEGGTRYEQALNFLRQRFLPALKTAKIPVQGMLFDESTELADGSKMAGSTPTGRKTDLGGAIAEALASTGNHPLAVVALTDGIANENSANMRALSSLSDAQVPFIGIGFGSDAGVRTLTLREIEAPSHVSTKTTFTISAQLEIVNAEDVPAFDLLLFRDGQLHQRKTVAPGKGSRTWLEGFQVSEDDQGVKNYAIQLMPPNLQNLKCVNLLANASVRVSDEKELRILYIQGAMTWDYKFIALALRNDQTIKLTGLTRTSKQSIFRQNVESAGELLNGFPSSVQELAPFRVVVLSNLRPADLTTAQQEVLTKFCGELGGGVLMLGGAGTFDASWQNSRLERLVPVVFASVNGVQGLDKPFRLELTEEALQNPIFRIADDKPLRETWLQLPTFLQYGRVDAAKPGAQIWALHPNDEGPKGNRILMAGQRYGAGLSAVICVQNFWRWRLGKESDPQQFDRFWRQMFRYLSESGRQDVSIHLAEQELHPDMDVQVVLQKQANPKSVLDTSAKFIARVENGRKRVLEEQALELPAAQPVDFKFHAQSADVYTITVCDSLNVPVASRSVEIREVNLELQSTARNMETLRQWAAVSEGLAVKAEECPDAGDLVAQIKAKLEQVRQGKQTRQPAGMNAWMLLLVLGTLSTEWGLRKKWGLI